MAHNFANPTRRTIHLEARHVQALRETLDQLRHEVADLCASRKRLAIAADADRRRIERELHTGVQQHLVALAVNLQLVSTLVETDPAEAKALLGEMERDVQQAMEETARLAQRIYAPLLDAGGLAAALRAVAASAGISARIEVTTGAGCRREVASAVYFCVLDVLEHAGDRARVTVSVQQEEEALVFEVLEEDPGTTARSVPELGGLHDRVEALGGRLVVRSEPGRGTRVSGSLPLSG